MNCETCGHLIQDYIDGSLSATQREVIETHLTVCAECRHELSTLRTLEDILHSRPLKTPPADFTRRTLVRLRGRKAFVGNNNWIAEALAYAASLVILLIGFNEVSSEWPLPMDLTQVFTEIASIDTSMITGAPSYLIQLSRDAFQPVAAILEASNGPITAGLPFGDPFQISAAAFLLMSAWLLYALLSD